MPRADIPVLNADVHAAGRGQLEATLLTAQISICTCGHDEAGVRLMDEPIQTQMVINNTEHSLNIWPLLGMSIDFLAVDHAFTLQPGYCAGFIIVSPDRAFIQYSPFCVLQ